MSQQAILLLLETSTATPKLGLQRGEEVEAWQDENKMILVNQA